MIRLPISNRAAVSCLALAFALSGCASDTTPSEQTGSLSLNLELADGVVINEVAWTISGGDMEPMSGTIDTSAPGATASVEVFGLPPGSGYLVELAATDESGQITCGGDAEFDVEVGLATDVMVFLNCKRPTRLGGVRVNGKFNICAELAKVVVSPLQTSVGNDIDLSAQTIDVEGDDVTIMWSATGGSIGDLNAAQTTYTCGEVGQQSITVTVSDDDFVYCMADWTVAVTCVEGQGDLCEGVSCEDDGNECTAEACNPSTGACDSTPVDDGTSCDGGAGVCMSGECVPNDLCEGVSCEDDGNECTTEACNPSTGACDSTPVDDGTSCDGGAGVCMSGECVPNDLCEGVTCEDDGNECTAEACDPSTGQCETSNVADGTECAGGVTELTTNGGFETGNTDGWTFFDNGGTFEVTMAQASTGDWSGNVVAPGPNASPLIKQANIGIGTVAPNSSVTISFDLYGSLAGAGGVVFAEFFSELSGGGVSGTEILGGGPLFPTDTWTNYTFTTTTGPDVSGGVTLQLKAACGAVEGCAVDAYFDNVSVTTESSGGVCMEGVCGPVDLCAGVICEDDGNECTAAACNPGTGECETSNVADGTPCNDGAGTCSAGVCEESSEGVVYTQDFETLDQASTTALGDAGFLVFGNVYSGTTGDVIGFYGPFPAPNNPAAAAFSLIASGQGGAEQGAEQLLIFSDYNNQAEMTAGNLVEALTFQEITIGAGDVGKTLTFSFQGKLGDLSGDSTAYAFIKTLAPPTYDQTNLVTVDTTSIPATWGNHSISLDIIAPLVGQILQFGFSATAMNNEPSGVFYDNIVVTTSPTP